MLLHAKGNLIDMAEAGDFTVIVHGCNCQNVMGSGIAAEIKRRSPRAYQADQLATQTWRNPVSKLGNFSSYAVHKSPHHFIIINAYTQIHYLPRGVDHFEYESFYLILRKLEALASDDVKFGFPYIGMGLAGGDPDRIIPMIENFADTISESGSSVTLVEFGS